MADLELTRTSAGRHLYALEGVGTLRLDGLFGRAATANTAGSTWRFSRRGFWGLMEVTDPAGRAVGTFEPRGRRGGRCVGASASSLSVRRVAGVSATRLR